MQFGGDEVVKAKDGAGSATLSMAYAGFRFAERVMQAVKGKAGIVEPTFVYLPGVDGGDAIKKETGCDYFSVPVELGPQGAVKAVNILGKRRYPNSPNLEMDCGWYSLLICYIRCRHGL